MCAFDDDEHYFLETHQFVYLSELMYIPIIAIANVLVIVSIWKVRRFHTPDNVLLVALAVVDLGIGVIVIPLQSLSYNLTTHHFFSGNLYVCRANYAITYALQVSSLSLLTLIIIFKSVSINRPFWYDKNIDNQVAKKTSMVVVAANFTLFIPLSLVAIEPIVISNYEMNIHYENIDRCLESSSPEHHYAIYTYTIAQLLVSCFLCAQIAVKAKRMKTSSKTDIKTHLVICLLFLFIILWLPTAMLTPLITSDWTPHFCSDWQFFSAQLRYFNSFANALACGVANRHMRHAFSYLMTNPPWKWAGLQAHMLQRDQKEVIRQYVKTLKKTIASDEEHPVAETYSPPPLKATTSPSKWKGMRAFMLKRDKKSVEGQYIKPSVAEKQVWSTCTPLSSLESETCPSKSHNSVVNMKLDHDNSNLQNSKSQEVKSCIPHISNKA